MSPAREWDVEVWDKRDRDIAWRKLFLSTAHGRTVLVELLDACGYNRALFDENPTVLARNAGRMEVAQIVMNRISGKASEIHDLVTQFQMKEMLRRENEMRQENHNEFRTPEVKAV